MTIKLKAEMILPYYSLFLLVWSLLAVAFFQIPGGFVLIFDFYALWFVFFLSISPRFTIFVLLAWGIFLPTLLSVGFLDIGFSLSLALAAILSVSFVTTYRVIIRRRIRYAA